MHKTHKIKKKIILYNLVWFILLLELAIFFYLAYFVFAPDSLEASKNQTHIILLYLSYVVGVASVPGVFKLYDLRRKKRNTFFSIDEKTEQYFFAKLIQFAVLEFAGIFLLITFYLNEFFQPIYLFGIIYLTVFFTKPSHKQLEKDFLTDESDFDEKIVYMPDEIEELNSKDTEE